MGRKARIDLETVLEAAAYVVDHQGWEHLSLAEVALRLGVKPPSLYNHVKGVDDVRRLLSRVAAQHLQQALMSATVGKSGRAAVLAMAQAHRTFVKGHPGLAAASAVAPKKSDAEGQKAARAVVDVCAAVLSGYDLQDDALIHVIRALRACVHGFASLEARNGFGLDTNVDDSFVWMVEAMIAGLTPI